MPLPLSEIVKESFSSGGGDDGDDASGSKYDNDDLPMIHPLSLVTKRESSFVDESSLGIMGRACIGHTR